MFNTEYLILMRIAGNVNGINHVCQIKVRAMEFYIDLGKIF